MQDNNIHISLLVIKNNLISYFLTQNMCSNGVLALIIYSPPVKLAYNACLCLALGILFSILIFFSPVAQNL